MIDMVWTLPKAVMQRKQRDVVPSHLVVSITCPDDAPVFTVETDRLITLSFHDITPTLALRFPEQMSAYQPCTSKDAEKIVRFIAHHASTPTKEYLVAQCAAGISRSGAVAEFANLYGTPKCRRWFRDLNRTILPNQWVLGKLIEAAIELGVWPPEKVLGNGGR